AYRVETEGGTTMRRAVVPSMAVLLFAAGIVMAKVESGLKVGEKAGAFNVKDCTGPAKGRSLCYR
ncbi:MAG: hypothetical protein D6725_18190, partial [Planctomycetota bacterium]